MNGLDKQNIEKILSDPTECPYRIMLKEFFEYDIPIQCQYRKMLRKFFEKSDYKEQDLDSGLI